MSRTCILHAGMHKTGSTSIQVALEGYADDRLVYAPLISSNHSFAMVDLFSGLSEAALAEFLAPRAPRDYLRRRATLGRDFRTLLESDRRDLLISAEELTGQMLQGGGIDNLLAALNPHFARVRLIAYVREPKSFVVSMQNQKLRERVTDFDPGRWYPGYRARLQPWIDRLGAENVDLVPYRRDALAGGDAIRDLAGRVGARLADGGLRSVNIGYTAEATALQQLWLRRLEGGRLPFRARAAISYGRRRVAEFGQAPFGIDPGLLSRIAARHAEDIGWIEGRLGCAFPDHRQKPGARLFRDQAELMACAAEAEGAFWRQIRGAWRPWKDSVLAIEAAGRTLAAQD